MIISGYNKKSIAEQTGIYSYLVDISLNNTTGRATFGFSGDVGNLFGFRLESGRVYDNFNKFIYGYNNDELISFKGYVSPSLHNIYINDRAITLNGYRPTGSTNYFYATVSNCVSQIDLTVSGEQPEYNLGSLYFTGTNTTGTGYILNTGLTKFRVYTGEEITSGDFNTITVPSGDIPSGSGVYTARRNYTLFDTEELSDNDTLFPFKFQTNFGQITGYVNVVTRFPIIQTLTNSLFTSISGATTGQGFLYWDNTKGQTSYLSGLSGNLTVSWLSGAFTGSFGDLFSVSTGNLSISGFNQFNYNASVTGFTTGFNTYSGDGLTFRLTRNYYNSTGYVLNFNYSGYNTGINYTITGF